MASTPASGQEVEIGYLEAIYRAEVEEMQRDERVILIAEDVEMMKQRVFSSIDPSRIRSAPISEPAFCGMALGAAMTGLRPIVDLVIASFVYVAMDALANQAAKLRYMFGGQATLPVVFRVAMWHGNHYAAHHSDRPYPMLMNVPGLKIAAPATPADAYGLLLTAIRDDDPVVLFEDRNLWGDRGMLPPGDGTVPLGRARLCRPGSDVTLVAISGMVSPALEAAEALAAEGVDVEVIDPRSLVPLDTDAILASVAKTGRLVVADLANRTCGAAAEISARVAEEAFDALRAPIRRVTTPDVPIPFAPGLEAPLYPDRERIAGALREVAGAA